VTDWLLGLVPQYGIWLVAVATFSSCLALPIPASILMIVAGGFVASGDLSLVATAGAALAGAVIGDQVGYLGGRWGGAHFNSRLGSRAAPIAKASALLATRGGIAVFLSRWLVSALGPYVNLAAGAAGLGWLHFTVWGVLGEVVWVAVYIGAGFAFSGNLAAASGMAFDLLGIVGAGVVAIGLGYWLLAVLRAEGRAPARRRRSADST
jgi:membrane protein DedA with SNARE-associated domain